MAEITTINSRKSLVHFSQKDLIELDLIKWVKSSFKGISKGGLIQDSPFELAAAKELTNKFPQTQVHLAEKCMYQCSDNSVDVILRTSQDKSSEMFNHNPIDLKTSEFSTLMEDHLFPSKKANEAFHHKTAKIPSSEELQNLLDSKKNNYTDESADQIDNDIANNQLAIEMYTDLSNATPYLEPKFINTFISTAIELESMIPDWDEWTESIVHNLQASKAKPQDIITSMGAVFRMSPSDVESLMYNF